MKDKHITMTSEEKQMLCRLMETPGIELEWDFFKGLNTNVPPPEFFMVDRTPMVPRRRVIWAWIGGAAAGILVGFGSAWLRIRRRSVSKGMIDR